MGLIIPETLCFRFRQPRTPTQNTKSPPLRLGPPARFPEKPQCGLGRQSKQRPEPLPCHTITPFRDYQADIRQVSMLAQGHCRSSGGRPRPATTVGGGADGTMERWTGQEFSGPGKTAGALEEAERLASLIDWRGRLRALSPTPWRRPNRIECIWSAGTSTARVRGCAGRGEPKPASPSALFLDRLARDRPAPAHRPARTGNLRRPLRLRRGTPADPRTSGWPDP